jgi:hypothetical protein
VISGAAIKDFLNGAAIEDFLNSPHHVATSATRVGQPALLRGRALCVYRAHPAQPFFSRGTAPCEGATRGLEEKPMLAFIAAVVALIDDLNGLVAPVISHGQDLGRRGLGPWVEARASAIQDGSAIEENADGVG